MNEAQLTLEQFADIFDLVLEVRRRNSKDSAESERWYAEFADCEVLKEPMLISGFGNGRTPEQAIREYARRISGTKLVKHAHIKESRVEFNVPHLS